MAVIGAAAAVLEDGPAKFREHQNQRVIVSGSEPFCEVSQPIAERFQVIRELPAD
jgi:hypothetical protein